MLPQSLREAKSVFLRATDTATKPLRYVHFRACYTRQISVQLVSQRCNEIAREVARKIAWCNSAFTYPNSKRDRLTCCNSESLSPSTPDFFIRSLPARSQLFENKTNTSEKNYSLRSCFFTCSYTAQPYGVSIQCILYENQKINRAANGKCEVPRAFMFSRRKRVHGSMRIAKNNSDPWWQRKTTRFRLKKTSHKCGINMVTWSFLPFAVFIYVRETIYGVSSRPKYLFVQSKRR